MMNDMNSTTSASASTDDSNMMTFSKWQAYRLHLLFSTWNITNAWQFALTFFAVVAAVVVLHFLECVIGCFQKGMIEYVKETASENSTQRPRGWTTVKILFGLVSACKYGLTLMLMLVAMTMNPSLFLALFVGYLLGDLIFCDYKLNSLLGARRPIEDYIVHKILHLSLCSRSPASPFSITETISSAPSSKSSNNWVSFYATGTLWIMPRIISLIFLVVLLVWIVQVEGGFGFDAASVFGWHALLMSFFVVMFTNEALLTYTAPLLPQLANDRLLLRYDMYKFYLCSIFVLFFSVIIRNNLLTSFPCFKGFGILSIILEACLASS